jgi:hypothetical protein
MKEVNEVPWKERTVRCKLMIHKYDKSSSDYMWGIKNCLLCGHQTIEQSDIGDGFY